MKPLPKKQFFITRKIQVLRKRRCWCLDIVVTFVGTSVELFNAVLEASLNYKLNIVHVYSIIGNLYFLLKTHNMRKITYFNVTAVLAFIKFIRTHLVTWIGKSSNCKEGEDFHFLNLSFKFRVKHSTYISLQLQVSQKLSQCGNSSIYSGQGLWVRPPVRKVRIGSSIYNFAYILVS